MIKRIRYIVTPIQRTMTKSKTNHKNNVNGNFILKNKKKGRSKE